MMAVASKRDREADNAVRRRILEAFSVKAKRSGIRAVVMGELASELRMSASTLYRHFASKEDLTLASVERWAAEVGAAEASEPSAESRRSGFDQFMFWAEAWADAMGSLSPAFIEDLRRDYPTAHECFQQEIRKRQRRGVELLRPILRPEINERVAFEVLDMIMSRAARADFAERLRITRHEAIRSAVSVWAGGALRRDAKLRKLAGGKRAGTTNRTQTNHGEGRP